MNSKKILIVANFCDYWNENSNNRFNYIAKMLSLRGCDVELVTSSFAHRDKKQREICEKEDANYKITLVYEPSYNKNVSLKRFYSHFIWGRNLAKYLKSIEKPDVIYCAVPSLSGPCAAARYCKKNNIKFIIDVQDLWPEAYKMIINIPVISDIVFLPFTLLANKAYRMADKIVAVSDTYADRAKKVNKKCEETCTLYLGTDLETFDKAAGSEVGIDKKEDELWLGYCGTLGSSYDLTSVIDALELLKKQGRTFPKFVVMGDGPRAKEFQECARSKDIDALFLGRLPYPKMCAVLSMCDIVVNPITSGAAQSIINKHADYAASGKALLNTQECPEYRRLVESFNMGINCENGNVSELAQKIELLCNNKELREKMGRNARICANEKFDRKNAYRVLEEIL